jgi:hypothetical protein
MGEREGSILAWMGLVSRGDVEFWQIEMCGVVFGSGSWGVKRGGRCASQETKKSTPGVVTAPLFWLPISLPCTGEGLSRRTSWGIFLTLIGLPINETDS